MQKPKCIAIVLAAGQGKRMGTTVQKQYLEIQGKPVLYYSLKVFEDSPIIDEIILVVGENQKEYCENEIIRKYNIKKVQRIVNGGAERYHSVWNGLQEIKDEGYVFIHDGARPFVNDTILENVYEGVKEYKACVVGMPVKDTIKVVDENGLAIETPDRSKLWLIQTPQVFDIALVQMAYDLLLQQENIKVTDDAMVVEQMLGKKVKLVQGSYENIKITTPEDLLIANEFLKNN